MKGDIIQLRSEYGEFTCSRRRWCHTPEQVAWIVTLFLTSIVLATSSPANAGTETKPISSHPWLLRSAIVVGGIGLMYTSDENMRDWVLERRNDSYETFADIVRPFGEYPVYVPVGVGLTLGGMATGSDVVKVTGERVVLSIAISAVAEGLLKYTLSRRRPGSSDGPDEFEFFGSHSSMPSGHATVAFALAKSLADDINRTWATVSLYSVATASSLARLVDDMHWFSDLGLGAALGFFSAEFVTDHILAPQRLREQDGGPELALLPTGMAVTWRF